MRIIKINQILVTLMIGLSIMSCKKDSDSLSNTSSSPTGVLMFHIHTYLENNEIEEYNVIDTTTEGRKIALSKAQFYISGIQLVKLDGTTYDVPDTKLLKEFETDIYFIGNVPIGNYKSVRFKVGLPPATNMEDPSSSKDSAILNNPEMWFGNTAQPDGYVFLNVQGKIDTTLTATGTAAQMQPFVYKIGTNGHYQQVNMPDKNFSIVQGQVEFVHIKADYNHLFEGVQINQGANLLVETIGDNALSPATIIANNISAMFDYEE